MTEISREPQGYEQPQGMQPVIPPQAEAGEPAQPGAEQTPLPPEPKPYFTVSPAGRELLERELPEIARELGMEGQEDRIAAAIAHLGISRQRWPDFLAHTPEHERDEKGAIRLALLRTAIRHGLDKGFYDQMHTSAREQAYGSGGPIHVVRPAVSAPSAAKAPAAQPAPAPKAEQPTAQAKPAPATKPEAKPAAKPVPAQVAETDKKTPEKTVVHAYVPTPERVAAARAFLAKLERRPDDRLTEAALGELAALQRDDPLTAEVITDGFDAAQRSLFRDYLTAHPLPKEGRRLFGRKKK